MNNNMSYMIGGDNYVRVQGTYYRYKCICVATYIPFEVCYNFCEPECQKFADVAIDDSHVLPIKLNMTYVYLGKVQRYAKHRTHCLNYHIHVFHFVVQMKELL